MVWPEYIPVFSVDDILEPPAREYEVGDQRTVIGWLKHLFLYESDAGDPDYMWITADSRKDYRKALDIAEKECKIRNVAQWEETATRKAQAALLNTIRRKLGYTQQFEVDYD